MIKNRNNSLGAKNNDSRLYMGALVILKSVDSIQDMLPEATILDGLAIQEHELQDAPAEVSEWLQGFGLIK